ncbi:MAG: hypothetical protein JNN20_18485 [Betaproteobacteria bacterium]|nr:hypothetical protein [Betaproteobacteria bacterium]
MAQTFEALVPEIWDLVCKNIDDILKECELHGLTEILTVPQPSVEARLIILKKFEGVCNTIIHALEAGPPGDEQYSMLRVMFNAKQQILNLEQLLNAAKRQDSKDFKAAETALRQQAKH